MKRIHFLELENRDDDERFRFIPAPLDSRRYSASGTAAREHCYIVLRATIKAESRTRKDDEEEEEEKGGETAMVFHHTVSFFLPFFLLLF